MTKRNATNLDDAAHNLPKHPDFPWDLQRLNAALGKFHQKHQFELQSFALRVLSLPELVSPKDMSIDPTRWDKITENEKVLFIVEFCKNEDSQEDYRQLVLKDVVLLGGGSNGQHKMADVHEEMRVCRWSFVIVSLVVGEEDEAGDIPRYSMPRLQRCQLDAEAVSAVGLIQEHPEVALESLKRSIVEGKGRTVWVS